MARTIDLVTLDGFAKDAARNWLSRDMPAPEPKNGKPRGKLFRAGPSFVIQSMKNFHFKDEFDVVYELLLDKYLPPGERDNFIKRAKDEFTPRDDKVFEQQLRERLAVDLDGNHIEGAIGLVQTGVRPIRRRLFEVETLLSIRRRKELIRAGEAKGIHVPGRTDRETEFRPMLEVWPVYAGEAEERGRPDEGAADPLPDDAVATLPDGSRPKGLSANVTNLSAEACIAGIDAIADRLDEGSTAAEIRGRTGAQPADPDAAETGTLLFTLPCSDPAVLAGVDDTDGTCSAAFDTITDDASADATGTLGYCRFAATGTGADDHIDGNATTDGTGATDWNTLEIVSGSTVSMTSASIGQSQGSTAT